MQVLLAGCDPEQTIAWSSGSAISRGRFVDDAMRLAQALPEATHTLNLCQDRYLFLLAFAAAGLRGLTSLLPASESVQALAKLSHDYEPATMLSDERVLAFMLNPALPASPVLPPAEILLESAVQGTSESSHDFNPDASRSIAIVFTSGSTGDPQPHPKSLRTLADTARLAAERLFDGRSVNIVATVPSQHMYGLETTAIFALTGLSAIHTARPFYPQDIAQALAEIPEPRVLVTVPVHLRALVAAGVALPPLHSVVCATSPLSAELAAAAEALLRCPVQEIYGCTEAGSVATRRTVEGPAWRLHRGMTIENVEQVERIGGAHLPEAVLLQDEVLVLQDGRFELLGRPGDLLKVAGKRYSLTELTHRLLALPGVVDAVVFMPEPNEAARPAALVVAPDLSEASIRDQLALQIDPVFLPRPLRKLSHLPRSETGKLPLAMLLELLYGPSA